MKKYIISILCVLFALPIFAQDLLQVYKKDGSIVSIALTEVDSIKFKRIPVIKVNSISLNRIAIGLLQGNTYTLQATIDYEGDTPVISWSSSNPEIASVDDNGNVMPLKAGSATITAKAGDKEIQCAITVVANGESVYRHGYSELSDSDKAIYNYMLKQILAFESNSKTYSDIYHRVYLDFYSQGITSIDQNKVMKLTNLIIKDVPEAYVLVNYIYRYDYNNYQYYLRVVNSCTPEGYASEMAQIYAACDNITQNITPTTTQFEKAKIIHDGYIDWADYGGVSNANCGNITGAFITKKAVCEGFSRAYLMLCQRVGLKSIYVTGAMRTSTTSDSWGNHAWNIAEVDGSWYMVDITADGGFAGMCGYSGFLTGSNTYSEGYRYESVSGSDENVGSVSYNALPTVSTTDYDWAERP